MRPMTAIMLLCAIILLAIPVGANVNFYGLAALNPDGFHSLHAGIGGDAPHRLGFYSNAAWLDESTFNTQSEIVVGYTWRLGALRFGGGFRFVSEDIKEFVELPNGTSVVETREERSWMVPHTTVEIALGSGRVMSGAAMTLVRSDEQIGLGWSTNVGYKILGNCAVSAAYIRPPYDDWRAGIWYGVSCEI